MKLAQLRTLLTSLLVITLACTIYAFGFVWCFLPNEIALGGVTGLAQVIHYAVPAIPVGLAVIVLNIPLFLLGWKFIGGRLLLGSLYAMAVSSVLIDLFAPLYRWQPMEPILACIFGGLTIGLALGLIFRQGCTTGGSDLAARLLKLRLKWLPMGKLILGVDLVVIVLIAIVLRTMNAMLYGLVALYISSLVMDHVLYSLDTAKVAYVISDQNEAICGALISRLDRGVTILQGQGAYTGAEKKVLMCAFKQREIAAIKAVVKDIDPGAFLIVCNAYEVLGDGFRVYNKNDL